GGMLAEVPGTVAQWRWHGGAEVAPLPDPPPAGEGIERRWEGCRLRVRKVAPCAGSYSAFAVPHRVSVDNVNARGHRTVRGARALAVSLLVLLAAGGQSWGQGRAGAETEEEKVFSDAEAAFDAGR